MCLSTPPGMVLRRARRIVSDLPRLSLRLRVPGLPSTPFLPRSKCGAHYYRAEYVASQRTLMVAHPLRMSSASSVLVTTASFPPFQSRWNASSKGVSSRADGGFLPSLTSIKIVWPLYPTNRSGSPLPSDKNLTDAPQPRSAFTISA